MDNAAQREFWSGDFGRAFAAEQMAFDRLFAPVTAALIAAAAPRPEMRALDIGCGASETTRLLAEAVGAQGDALGVDISAPLIEAARAAAAGTAARFIEADAATATLDPVDLIVSRFGIMFFADPVAAFAKLRGDMRADGRIVFACWRAFRDNDWARTPFFAVTPLLPDRAPVDPHAPGPFALADGDRVHAILTQACWRDIALTPLDFAMTVGDGPDPVARAVEFSLRLGPAAAALREAEQAGFDVRAAAETALAAVLRPRVAEGRIALGAAAWLVTAGA